MLYPLSHKGIKNSPRGSTWAGLVAGAGARSLGRWAKELLTDRLPTWVLGGAAACAQRVAQGRSGKP